MKALVLGAVGAMGSHATTALASTGLFDQILLADIDHAGVQQLAGEWGSPLKASAPLDVRDQGALKRSMAVHPDVIVNALPKQFTIVVAQAAIATGTRVIDLGSLSPELHALGAQARTAGAVYVAGCGSSSGLTNMMAKHGARGMDEIVDIEINIASFRSIALSVSSIHGVFWEFGPGSERGYYADGAYHTVSLWDDAQTVDFADPIGRQTVYVLPHSEPHTLSRNLGAKQVVVRGTFTPKVMLLMRALNEYGFFEPKPVTIDGRSISRKELITQYLAQVPEANSEPVWGYGLHVCVTGREDKHRLRRTLWTSHPSPEAPGWSGSDAWAKCVAMPLVAGSLLLARGEYEGSGIDAPEAFLPTEAFLGELKLLGLDVHEKEEEISGS